MSLEQIRVAHALSCTFPLSTAHLQFDCGRRAVAIYRRPESVDLVRCSAHAGPQADADAKRMGYRRHAAQTYEGAEQPGCSCGKSRFPHP